MKRATRSTRGRLARAPKRLLRVFAQIILIVVVAFALSGVNAFAGDDVRECCTDCPDGDDGKDCPPGCPSCHCAHGSVAVPKSVDEGLVIRRDPERVATLSPEEATAPRAPIQRGVYRPPRTRVRAV